jgi:hypothetical protein
LKSFLFNVLNEALTVNHNRSARQRFRWRLPLSARDDTRQTAAVKSRRPAGTRDTPSDALSKAAMVFFFFFFFFLSFFFLLFFFFSSSFFLLLLYFILLLLLRNSSSSYSSSSSPFLLILLLFLLFILLLILLTAAGPRARAAHPPTLSVRLRWSLWATRRTVTYDR